MDVEQQSHRGGDIAKKNAARRPRFSCFKALDPGSLAGMTISPRLDPVSPAIRGLHGIITSCNYFPIFTSVTSKISVAFGGKPFFGCEPYARSDGITNL